LRTGLSGSLQWNFGSLEGAVSISELGHCRRSAGFRFGVGGGNHGGHDLGGAEVVRPDVRGLLPVFVLDRYDGYRVELLQDLSREELDDWVDTNATAIRERLPADLVFCNHVLLGGAVGEASGATYSVKAHGSEPGYPERGRTLFPGLSGQPRGANAVKHGFGPQPEGGVVRVAARIEDGFVAVSVSDTGPGFEAAPDSAGTGVGLDNVRQRLSLYYGAAAILETGRRGGETVVSFRAPVMEK